MPCRLINDNKWGGVPNQKQLLYLTDTHAHTRRHILTHTHTHA